MGAITLTIFYEDPFWVGVVERQENGYRIISQEYRTFFRGPFFWTSTKGQTIYYVVVEDDGGNQRRGWVRCGGWWLGLLSNRVEVRWDD